MFILILQVLDASGPSPLVSCASAIWPLVCELKSRQRQFLRALGAYASLLFHPRLLLSPSTSADVLQLQQKVSIAISVCYNIGALL